MDKQPNENPEMYADKKSNFLPAIILAPVVIVFLCSLAYMSVFDVFKDPPKVEIQAQNKFEKTLRVVTDIDYAPYSYVDENGNYQGLDVEMMNELANRMRMNLDLKLKDWVIANKMFEDGEADIIMNMESDVIVNNSKFIASLPTTEKQYVVYGKSSISTVAELYGRRVASLHRMSGLGLDDEITYINSYQRIFEDLKNGEYEF
ncbi:MAG: transporter substrate-binding domain-containing protein, partial [Selenomonadaceae bacterium]|nr:transporter substrate-binding domain-containing protein [Selenomonadaceae bacterium]